MFRFTQPEDGSEERFHQRIEVHKEKDIPLRRHHFWWFIHNCVCHPLIGILPMGWTFKLHDWTSHKINAKEEE